jgi:hypothetical protein
MISRKSGIHSFKNLMNTSQTPNYNKGQDTNSTKKCKMCFPNIDQYISDFEELVRQAGYTIGNEETISFFLNGLTPSILDEVIRAPFPNTYTEHKAKAIEIMKGRQMIELIRARRGLPNPNHSITLSVRTETNSNCGPRETINRTNQVDNNNNSNKGRHIAPPMHHAPPITMCKFQWMYPAPEHHITVDSTSVTTCIQMPQ